MQRRDRTVVECWRARHDIYRGGLAKWVVIFGVFILLAGRPESIDARSTLPRAQLAGTLGMTASDTIFVGSVLYRVSHWPALEVGPIESIFLNTTVSLVESFSIRAGKRPASRRPGHVTMD